MISIIVPVYNAEAYLRQCIDSLLSQTFEDIEIICVDDGSTDASASILTEYALKDCRLKVITQSNKGVSASRNRGIEESSGNWLMFVDSDDWIDPDTCELAYKTAIVSYANVVFWSYISEFQDGRSVPHFLMDRYCEFKDKNKRMLHRRIIGPVGKELHNPALLHSWGTVWGKLYDRKIIGEVTFTDTRIVGSAEDALFNAEIFNNVDKAAYINKAMYHYRKTEKSFTRGYNKNLNKGWETLYTLFSNIITTYNLQDDFNEALNNRIALGLIGQGLNECKSPRNIHGKIKRIKQIITTDQYRDAIMKLQFKYFPIHWKFFFGTVKAGNAFVLFIFLSIIMKLK